MHSCLYRGRISHRRFTPRLHHFRYAIFYLYLDLDELEQVFEKRWLWSTKRPALARFCRSDHAGNPQRPLKEHIADLVEQHTGRRHSGPIRLLTQLRYFGYVFNPVSFYYCFDASGEQLETVVAEVNNTPWGEQHIYVLPLNSGKQRKQSNYVELDKAFHVSPFMPMDIHYRWGFTAPQQRLSVQMENYRNGKKIFHASLGLTREPITSVNCARVLLSYPLITLKIISAIYWQALRLWLKGTPLFIHPNKHHRSKGGADTAKTV